MYTVSSAFKTAIKSTSRTFAFKMDITEASATATVTDADIVQGTPTLTEQVMQNGSYAPGAAIASDFEITLFSNNVLKDINYAAATLSPSVGLVLPDKTIEYVPLGKFFPDDISIKNGFIVLKAADAMLKLDKDISVAKLTPGVLQYYLETICTACGVPIDTGMEFTNYDYDIRTPPKGISCRTAVQYIAALAGCWAKIDRTGKMVLRRPDYNLSVGPWNYAESYDGSNRYDFTASQKTYACVGLVCKKTNANNNFSNTANNGIYAINLDYSDNPFVQGTYIEQNAALAKTADTLYQYWEGVNGFSSNWQGNPALEAGDVVKNTDAKGNVFSCLVGKSVYKYRGECTMSHDISDSSDNAGSVSAEISAMKSTMNSTDTSAPIWAGLASYADNVYTVSLPNITSIADGFGVVFKVDADCSSPSLKISDLAAIPIKLDTGDALDCHAGGIYEVRYNATNGNFMAVKKGGGSNRLSGEIVKTSEKIVDEGYICLVQDENFLYACTYAKIVKFEKENLTKVKELNFPNGVSITDSRRIHLCEDDGSLYVYSSKSILKINKSLDSINYTYTLSSDRDTDGCIANDSQFVYVATVTNTNIQVLNKSDLSFAFNIDVSSFSSKGFYQISVFNNKLAVAHDEGVALIDIPSRTIQWNCESSAFQYGLFQDENSIYGLTSDCTLVSFDYDSNIKFTFTLSNDWNDGCFSNSYNSKYIFCFPNVTHFYYKGITYYLSSIMIVNKKTGICELSRTYIDNIGSQSGGMILACADEQYVYYTNEFKFQILKFKI